MSTSVSLEAIYCKNYPFRVPNWRWCRAGRLLDAQSIPRTDDNDADVLAAIRFQRRIREGKRVDSDEEIAYSLSNNQSYEIFRWEIEARLISGQSDEEIAERMGMRERAVARYESWFYNVRDKLDVHSYLFNMLVLPVLGDEPSKEAIWKLYAAVGGKDVIDEVIYDGGVIKTGPGQFWAVELLGTLSRKCAITARFGGMAGLQALSRVFQAYKELNVERPEEAESGVALEHVKAVTEALNWQWGKSPDDKLMIGSASLRNEEILELGGKEPSEKFKAMLQSAEFPKK